LALFKIEKGLAADLITNRPDTNEGWCYFTTDDGKFYIDINTATGDTSGRVPLNAKYADALTVSAGDKANPVYFENGLPVVCTDLKLDDYLPLTAGEESKLTGPLGLTQEIMYGTELPENMFEG
jgi:hypothetical protein